MFNLQGSEIIIVLLLALVVLGPEKLPDAMRRMGQAYAELKKMSSGFQNEFRAAVDEPMRELRETANVIRDSADFTKLQDGEREEKPKSAEMAAADPDAVPTDDLPTFDTGAPVDDGPAPAPASQPAPFEEESDAAADTATGEARSDRAPIEGLDPADDAADRSIPSDDRSSAPASNDDGHDTTR